ncbi:M14 family murein peptide amidase A [Sulfuriflexus sp.]|uniref:M14 family murein peptide amidase A n=1 Tax=Sulfuriflexus sp. TaxID=2015443 RepID=UPI0028CF675A|nr:M14 family murein peptide amidase A [Sulfuriflexus sp.]MDT8404120.1 M14 family murein peptide amidase A [Sulfuriflexus sp.]
MIAAGRAFILLAAMAAMPTVSATELQVADVCQRIAGKLASVKYAECDAGLQLTEARSIQGTPILMKEYPPLDGRQPQSRVLMIGGIHGDEYSSVSVVFKWMNKLDQYHSGLFHWKVVPLLNPDGLLQGKSRRMNANGVDLNRNFPTHNWEEETNRYWVKRTYRNPRRYPGKAALSEPESRWLYELIEEFRPDAIVSVHAPYGVLDFDGPPRAPKRLGHLSLNLLGAYPGSLGNYAGVENKIPVITIELPHAGIMPTPAQISHIWVDLVRWLQNNTPRKAEVRIPTVAGEDQAGPS